MFPSLFSGQQNCPKAKRYDHPVMNLDVLPTAVFAAGGKTESAWKLDGVDLVPYLNGSKSDKPHETMFWRYGEQWAVRDGDYKLVVSKGGSGKPELYNLATDRNERKIYLPASPTKSRATH